ncbi:MAG TPA: hypothetical protein V6C72_15790, partial [Chroococcales cyanobacterium]
YQVPVQSLRRTLPQPFPQPQIQPQDNDANLPPAIGVTDPGAAGAPPDQSQRPVAPLTGTIEGQGRNGSNQYSGQAAAYGQQMPPMPSTTTVSPKVFRGWLTRNYADLNTAAKGQIIEVKGQWDDSGHILHSFGLLADKVNPNKVAQMSLDGVAVLVVDCAGEIPNQGLPAIEAFVRKGGYLLTTDWALDGCLARAIPGYVDWNGGYSRAELVDATVVSPNPDLVRGAVPRAYWKLDSKCQTVKVNRPQSVEVLVTSQTLAREDPNGLGALAVTFKHGRGRVLHLVGHFDTNSSGAFTNALPDPAPGIGISLRQALAANFIMCALQAHQEKEAKTAQQ